MDNQFPSQPNFPQKVEMQEKVFTINVPQGPLGIHITKQPNTGVCVVSRVDGDTSHGLKVGDLILSIVDSRQSFRLLPSQRLEEWEETIGLTADLEDRQVKVRRMVPKTKVVRKRKASSSPPSTKQLKKPPPGSKNPPANAIDLPRVRLNLEDHPSPGHVSACKSYYICKNGENLANVADKLGCRGGFSTLANILENWQNYGELRGTTKFLSHTILRIPPEPQVSRWMCEKLLEREDQDDKLHRACCLGDSGDEGFDEEAKNDDKDSVDIIVCLVCESSRDVPGNDILLCDGCNAATHLKCCNLKAVPRGDWFCQDCLEILRARKEYHSDHSLIHCVPPLPSAVVEDPTLVSQADLYMSQFLLTKYNEYDASCRAAAVAPGRESNGHFDKRYFKLLGFCMLTTESDIKVMQTLARHRLITGFPMQEDGSDANQFVREKNGEEGYAIFGTYELWRTQRDDKLPWKETGAHKDKVRDAQRKLMVILKADKRNSSMVVTEPTSLASVVPRDGAASDTKAAAKCFGLSELVHDCTTDLDLPKASTPLKLAERGLQLHDHQQVSLQWMLDKEKNPTGLGLASELWSRHRFLDGSGDGYYFCELTGSFAMDIFDFGRHVDQKDAAANFASLPVGGILGLEMGLGKTIVCLALVVANPPPYHNRVLPREYKWKCKSDHPEYFPLANQADLRLSNGTLVIAPMTLSSQWKAEVERFAPWMTVIAIHTNDSYKLDKLVSADIIIASTDILQNKKGAKTLMNQLKKIHFHRLLVDEAHGNQQGPKTRGAFTTLSATSRFCVTGTPLGNSLRDLFGQLFFLRVPQFCRSKFWEKNISEPYDKHCHDSLQILRSLLSRYIVRHTKAQIASHGQAVLGLPPRTVETVLLNFGTESERQVYEMMETQNQTRLEQLLEVGGSTAVLSKYQELHGLCLFSRQACCHTSLVYISKLNAMYYRIKGKDLELSSILSSKADKDRNSILQEAVAKAKPTCKGRVRELALMFQENAAAEECSICIEYIEEKNCALTPCGHAFCRECILNILKETQTRHRQEDPVGDCPNCRERILRSSLTMLGEAKDAGQEKSQRQDECEPVAKKLPSSLPNCDWSGSVNGFQMMSKDVRISAAATSSTKRTNHVELTLDDRRYQRAHYTDLEDGFAAKHEDASSRIGTKISQLLTEIQSMHEKDAASKCVVFSQFSEQLDIAADELLARGINFVRVDGCMKQFERADALHAFSTNQMISVCLLSVKAGAVGLNLTAANYCFILDTCQHTAREEQAIDRIHRIGQTRPVVVKRFVMAGTIEERILNTRRRMTNSVTPTSGSGVAANDDSDLRPVHRLRALNENEKPSEHLRNLEAWFGVSISDKRTPTPPLKEG